MKYTRNYLFWFAIASISTILLTACHKDPSRVGFNIQPGSDNIELYGDSTTVVFVSYTVEHDSLATTNMSTLVVGSINDPIFGSTQAAFNAQFRLSRINPYLGRDVSFDSICLHLGYSSTPQWGDATTEMTAYVYRLTDSLWLNSDDTAGDVRDAYYATSTVLYDRVPLGSKTFLDQPSDSTDTKRFWLKRTSDVSSYVSIPLSETFGKELLSSVSDSTIGNDDFLKILYGLRVDVDSISSSFGKMLYFNPDSTKLVLYYNYLNTNTNERADSIYTFIIDKSRSIRFNEYRTDYSTACDELQKQLASSSPASGNQKLYLQPFSGVRIKVNFDGIEKLREKKNIVINEAKLYLNNAEPYNKDMLPVQQFAVYTVNTSGKTVLTPDAELGMTYMGGKFNSGKNRYETRITRYLQRRILDPSMDNDNLYISISGASFNANRVVLFGNDPDDENDKKAKIRILYSEY